MNVETTLSQEHWNAITDVLGELFTDHLAQTMAKHNLSDVDWESLSTETQDTLLFADNAKMRYVRDVSHAFAWSDRIVCADEDEEAQSND